MDPLYEPSVLATDTTDYQANTLTRIAQGATYGLGSALASGLISIKNTVADYGGGQQTDVEDAVRRFGGNAMGDYYAENKSAIDTVGFIGTSFIPGTLGIKGLNLLRGGNALGNFGKMLALPATRKDAYLKAALQELGQNGGVVKGILSSAARRKQLVWETADQAMMAGAYEIATVATMHDSPFLTDDSVSDMAWNSGVGVLMGAAIGGPLGAMAARGILKSAESVVQKGLRAVDVVTDSKQLGLLKGTETLLLAESIVSLPDATGKTVIKFKNSFGKAEDLDLGTESLFAKSKADSTKTGMNALAIRFNELAGGDATTGQSFFNALQGRLQLLRESGASAEEQVQVMHGFLNSVSNVSPVDLKRAVTDTKKFYTVVNPPKLAPEDRNVFNMFSRDITRATGKQAYRLADDVTFDQLTRVNRSDFPSELQTKQIFNQSPNVDMMVMQDGTYRFNPKSKKVLQVNEDTTKLTKLLDLESMAISRESTLGFGDVSRKAQIAVNQISDGNMVFKQEASRQLDLLANPMHNSARFAWASKLTAGQFAKLTDKVIDMNDLPMLDRFIELTNSNQISAVQATEYGFRDGKAVRDHLDFFNGFAKLGEERRLELLKTQLAAITDHAKVPDTKALSISLNTDQAWVESAITHGFASPEVAAYKGTIHNTERALTPRTVEVTWDFGAPIKAGKMTPEELYSMNMGPNHLVTGMLARQTQLDVARKINEAAATAVLGADDSLIPLANSFVGKGEKLVRSASADGSGATVFGAANAGFGERAKLFVQELGKNVSLITQRTRDAVVEALSPSVNAIKANKQASAELGILTSALRHSTLRYIVDPTTPNRLISTEVARAAKAVGGDVDRAIELLAAKAERYSPPSFTIKNADVARFIAQSTAINAARQQKFLVLHNAMGLAKNAPEHAIVYAPPINTVEYPYHAFVKTRPAVGVATETGMITARTDEQLKAIAAELSDRFDIHYKADTDAYYKAKGEYEYSNTLHEARINSELNRSGKLADFAPETNAEAVLTDWLAFHAKQEERLVRNAVEVKNREFFSELGHLSNVYRREVESQTKGIGAKLRSKISDPFGDHIKTALNISKQHEFPLLDSLNEFIDKLGIAAGNAANKAFHDAHNKTIGWEEANLVAHRYGLGSPYTNDNMYMIVNERMPKNLVREFFQKASTTLAATTLRLDFINPLINIISTPIMLGTEMASIKRMLASDPEALGKLGELMNIAVPGKPGVTIASNTKLIANSVNNWFSADKQLLIDRYKSIGTIKEITQLHHQMLDDLSFNSALHHSQIMDKLNKAVEIGSKYTGNAFAEDFTRFISSDVMRQMSDPLVKTGKLTIQEQNAYISTFVNRVQGNYVTSQRPVMFQGTTGAAISLFQTYAFNVLQQLYRHVQAGDKKTLLTYASLQSSLFGLNGLPFFDAVNTHIIGSALANNPDHKDVYSLLPSFNKELGDWMLYGTASAFPLFSDKMPALYTRGDINPRHVTIVPILPQDVPVVSAGLKLYDTVMGMGKNIVAGADISNTLLSALEHQGLSRPLAGMAQVFAGRSTTSKGALISGANEFEATSMLASMQDRMINFGGAARLAGAKPMAESVALNALYREKKYEVMDKVRIERLGEVVKSKLYDNQMPSDEEYNDFMLRYARSGGRIETFNQAYVNWTKDANESIITQMAKKNNNSFSVKLMEIMGGDVSSFNPQQASGEMQ